MGYRGKVEEQHRARQLRARAWTLQEIADELDVAKSSVSLWVRDVDFDPSSRRSAVTHRRPRGIDHPLRRRKLAEIAECDERGREVVGELSDRDLLIAGAALYAGEGTKRDGVVVDHWTAVTGVPASQFSKPYRAVPDASVRRTKHEHGCATVRYTCSRTHREVMGLVRALLGGRDA